MKERLRQDLDEHRAVAEAMTELLSAAAAVVDALRSALEKGGKLIVFGNGGSAADAQHFVAELLAHYHRDRRPLPAVALTTDTSVLTATANDYEFEEIFSRQVRAMAGSGDVVVGITTSGGSENVVRGLEAATERGATTVAMTGAGGLDRGSVDHLLAVPSEMTARIQEMHILLIHMISEEIDAWAAEER